MQFSTFFASLFLATAVVAAPVSQNERDLGDVLGSIVGSGSNNKDNGNGSGSGNSAGNGSGSENGNGSGSGNEAGNGNEIGSGNDATFLNDIGNISIGEESSRQIAEDVVTYIKTLSMSCIGDGNGGMRCSWS